MGRLHDRNRALAHKRATHGGDPRSLLSAIGPRPVAHAHRLRVTVKEPCTRGSGDGAVPRIRAHVNPARPVRIEGVRESNLLSSIQNRRSQAY